MPASTFQPPVFLGIDVGGTNIKLGLVDDSGRPLAKTSIRTHEEQGAERGCERIAEAAMQLLDEAMLPKHSLVRAGLVTPGPIDVPRGLVLRPGNIPGWWDFPIRERASHHLGLPITFNNDANAAAYGEFWKGAGAEHQSMILLTLGTGVGGGIIIGDMLIDGMHNCGGECGHILVDPSDDAPRDTAGKSGSLESYCNAAALVARVRAALNAGEKSSLANLPTHAEFTPRVIAEAAENGDALARRAIMVTAHWLAMGIVSLVHTIDPDAVVLGGAMTFGGASSPLGRAFIEQIRSEVRPRLLLPLREVIKIEFASLGGDAGFIGAAGLARIDQKKVGGPVTTLGQSS